MDEREYLEIWAGLKDEVKSFGEMDDLGLIFGSSTRGFGHFYKTLPVVPEQELAEFERRTGLELPLEYRTYLQAFGAGGAGPNYGIYDFREKAQHQDFPDPFPLSSAEESVYGFDDFSDDDPIWDMPGTAPLCSHGCGIVTYIVLNGPEPGQLWCEADADFFALGNIYGFYRKWADQTRLYLKRYGLLKSVVEGASFSDPPKGITLKAIAGIMDCKYRELEAGTASFIAEGETWIYFRDTPGQVILNEKRELIRIEPMMVS